MAVPRIQPAEQRALAELLAEMGRSLAGHAGTNPEMRGYLSGTLETLAEELRGHDGRRLESFYLGERRLRLAAKRADLEQAGRAERSRRGEIEQARAEAAAEGSR